jgi:tRNA(fMet)-specific endonuclease VapC
MYLLDIDTIIYSMKGHSAVESNVRLHLHDPIKICAVTLMELYYGIHKSREVTSNLAKVRMIENAIEVLPVGTECAEVFGILKAELEKAGSPLDDFDLTIAACAIVNNLTLVTNNTRHFERIKGLRQVNWTMPVS